MITPDAEIEASPRRCTTTGTSRGLGAPSCHDTGQRWAASPYQQVRMATTRINECQSRPEPNKHVKLAGHGLEPVA